MLNAANGEMDTALKKYRQMKTITLTKSDFQKLRALQEKYRADWPAIFSANRNGQIWVWTHYGNTPRPERICVQGQNKIIDAVASEYLRVRFDLGRFFIDDEGAYCHPQGQPLNHFVKFDIL